MGRMIDLRSALAADPNPLRAPPAWRNSEVGTVNGVVVLHAGGGRLDGRWHSQDSDELLLVVSGELVVEFEAGALTARPGQAILISKGERHRAAVADDCLLLSVEAAAMRRFDG